MSELILYNDKSKLFECDIKLQGAKLSNTKARLILEFDDGPTVLYAGDINSLGECKIEIPAIKYDSKNGQAILEVIAESTVFEPWKSSFIVKRLKQVKVEVKEPKKSKIKKPLVEVKIKAPKKKRQIDESKKFMAVNPQYAKLIERSGAKTKKDILKVLKFAKTKGLR